MAVIVYGCPPKTGEYVCIVVKAWYEWYTGVYMCVWAKEYSIECNVHRRPIFLTRGHGVGQGETVPSEDLM